MNRTKSALSVLAVAGLLTLMGCSSDSDDDAATTTAPPTTEDVTTTEAPDESTLPAPQSTVTEAPDTDTDASADEPTSSEVTVTVAGTDTVVNPDKVYCSGEEGNIRHIIGKTNNQPPLVEATPGEFAMVKIDQQGAPYKSESPTGITFGDKSATFDNVTLGSATVNGDLVCTDWED